MQADGRTFYEIDLAPQSDEASAKLIVIYHLDYDVVRNQLQGLIDATDKIRLVVATIPGVDINAKDELGN